MRTYYHYDIIVLYIIIVVHKNLYQPQYTTAAATTLATSYIPIRFVLSVYIY